MAAGNVCLDHLLDELIEVDLWFPAQLTSGFLGISDQKINLSVRCEYLCWPEVARIHANDNFAGILNVIKVIPSECQSH